MHVQCCLSTRAWCLPSCSPEQAQNHCCAHPLWVTFCTCIHFVHPYCSPSKGNGGGSSSYGGGSYGGGKPYGNTPAVGRDTCYKCGQAGEQWEDWDEGLRFLYRQHITTVINSGWRHLISGPQGFEQACYDGPSRVTGVSNGCGAWEKHALMLTIAFSPCAGRGCYPKKGR